MSRLFFDVECYPNYFLILFKLANGKKKCFELDETKKLDIHLIEDFLQNTETVGFNSRQYDMPMILLALSGATNKELKTFSDRLIGKEEKTYDILKKEKLWCPWSYNHIDIFNVAAGGKTSLKMYGARIHTAFLQDLPYDPSLPLTEEQKVDIKEYCSNDVDLTMDLFDHLEKELAIRAGINKAYNVDVRSKSDAQIAEVLIKKEVSSPMVGEGKDYNFKYAAPSYIKFHGAELTELLETISSVEFKGKKGDVIFNDAVPSSIVVNGSTYSIGVGGLHSTEKHRSVVAQEDEYLIDVDVVSYYPSIILNNSYAPAQFNKDSFVEYYRNIYNARIEAKKNGDSAKSKVYKIILNGSFGKFGDQHSELYAPKLLIHTTVTGQLSLLMLIEKMELANFKVVSANTDSVTVVVKKDAYEQFQQLITDWGNVASFKLEEERYRAAYSESVNSYIAIKEDGGLKCKGTFVDNDIAHNPTIKVCKDAVLGYLLNGTKIEDTVMNYEPLPSNFLMARKVMSGGYWKGEYLGKVVRWYWSTDGAEIRGKINLNNLKKDGTPKKPPKASDSDDAFPIMDLNTPMVNIHYEKYIAHSYELLERVGVVVA